MTERERRELTRELDRYRGSWVVVRDAKVVASAPTMAELEKTVDRQPGDRTLAVKARHAEPYLRR